MPESYMEFIARMSKRPYREWKALIRRHLARVGVKSSHPRYKLLRDVCWDDAHTYRAQG